MNWIINNIGTVLSLAAIVLGIVTTWVIYGADIKQLKADRDDLRRRDEERRLEIEKVRELVRAHQFETSIHIDPARDDRRWDDFKSEIARRFDLIETKIDRLQIFQPPPGQR